MTSQNSSKLNLYVLPIALLLITVLVFLPSLWLHFVDWDDPEYLLKNASLTSFTTHWSWSAVYDIFTSKVGANYNPLPIFTYAVETCFFAPDIHASPFIFHLDNVLLHLGCTLCVYLLFIKMGVSRIGAFLGALLFGIHPMRVESVSWITERKDVLYGLFYLLALLAYVNYIKAGSQKSKWYVITLVVSVFSYFSKIQAVSLPLSMIALDFYYHRKWWDRRVLLNEKLPWWALSVIIGLVNLHLLNTLHIINSEPQLGSYGLIDKLAIGAYSYIVYLVKFIYPYQMLHWYVYPVHLPLAAYISLGILPVITMIFIGKMYKNTQIMFGWLFFTFNVIFILQIVPAGKAFMADRFTYIAYTGLFFILANIYDWASAKYLKIKPVLYSLLVLYLGCFAVTTYKQEGVWMNTMTLWGHYIKVKPKDSFGYIQLGNFCINAVLTDTTLNMDMPVKDLKFAGYRNYKMADNIDSLSGRPDKVATLSIFQGLGSYFGCIGNYDSAEYFFTRQMAIISKEVATDPNDKDVYADRALTYYHNKKYDLALKDYRKVLDFDHKNDGAYYRCSLCEGYLGKYREGLNDVNIALSLDSSQADYYFTRAKLYRLLNVIDSSRADAYKAKAMGAHVADKWLQ